LEACGTGTDIPVLASTPRRQFYQLNIPEVWQTWNFKQRFPDHVELREYFAHIDKTLGLRKDVEFNSRVNGVTYDDHTARWIVKTDKGHIAACKYVILATGLLHRRLIPDFPGLDLFEGEVHHSGFWPDNLSVKGKKVGLIGAGATAVQITQELGKQGIRRQNLDISNFHFRLWT
jgi:cation diffusion facilitator CzcD-associated flavoprotein CzcO